MSPAPQQYEAKAGSNPRPLQGHTYWLWAERLFRWHRIHVPIGVTPASCCGSRPAADVSPWLTKVEASCHNGYHKHAQCESEQQLFVRVAEQARDCLRIGSG